MARQVIDTSPPIGTPAPTAFDIINAMTLELYGQNLLQGGLIEGALTLGGAAAALWVQDRTQARDYAWYASGGALRLAAALRGQSSVDLLQVDAAGSISFNGRVARPGIYLAENFRIMNSGTEQGIGGTFASWGNDRQPALQVDAQLNTVAYMALRVTHWGVKHMFGMDVYEGGTGSGAQTTVNFHFATAIQRHQFIDNGSMIIAGTLTQNSDYRIKADVDAVLPEVAAKAMRLVRAIEYTDIEDNGKRPRRAGVLAHELQNAFPLLVHGSKDEMQTVTVVEGDTTPYEPGMEPEGYEPPLPVERNVPKLQNVNYAGMAPYLAAAWQHSDARIGDLEREREELLQRVEALAARLDALESAA